MDEKEKLKLKRSLKSRHVTMIAIGGAIGTGLFLGSGTAIQSAGPSIILSYLIVGIISFFMMADLTATGIYLKYWFKNLPQWVGPLVIVILLMLVNMVNVGLFGELESWFSMIKVLAILALIITGLILLIMHTKIDSRTVSLSNLVNYGGFFPTGSWGFLKSFQMVVFAFVGIEIVGLTAGETANPDKDIPKAINTLPVRIGLFYVGSMIAIMAVYPWNKIVTTTSPFVQVFGAIGIPAAAGILNFVVLTAAMSATNSAIFSTSRSLYALSRGNNATKRFGKLSKKAVPNNALTFSSLILFIVVILNYIMPAQVFDIISSVSTINFIMVWIIIMWTHLKYRAENKEQLGKFRMPGFPITSWITIIFYLVILVILALIPATRLPLIISIIFILALALSYTLLERRKSK